jgi:hypothetical protein
LVDQWGERVGHYATLAGHQLLYVAARVGEELEDIWAEAQSIRHALAPAQPPPQEHGTDGRRGEP